MLGIWALSEETAELLRMLDPGEATAAMYNALNYDWRKRQWLASRLLVKMMGGDQSPEIVYDQYNKPYLAGSAKHISISHSYDRIAVIMDDEKETGIDIELVKPKIGRIAEKFMSDEEMRAAEGENRIESLYVYWCAKESLYKLYGKKELIFKENIIIEPFEYNNEGNIRGRIATESYNKSFELRYERTGEHMLVYVVNNND
jgi:4'-phosphopantetheinyl transferase